MNKTRSQTLEYLNKFVKGVAHVSTTEIGVAPAFTSLVTACDILKNTNVKLCAQNVHWDESGQYTGEISPSMLKDYNVDYAIIGHSERRKFFGETNDSVNKRVKGALKSGLKIILCVGETKEEREAGKTQSVVKSHLTGGLDGVSAQDLLKSITIAYEPVWAIGTGLNATVDQAVEVHKFIRATLDTAYGAGTSEKVRILYGGSVKPDNIDGFMATADIDGALVGGASLEAESFIRIVDFKEV